MNAVNSFQSAATLSIEGCVYEKHGGFRFCYEAFEL